MAMAASCEGGTAGEPGALPPYPGMARGLVADGEDAGDAAGGVPGR